MEALSAVFFMAEMRLSWIDFTVEALTHFPPCFVEINVIALLTALLLSLAQDGAETAEPRLVVSGRVVDSSGAAVPRLEVLLNGWSSDLKEVRVRTLTAEDGTFRLESPSGVAVGRGKEPEMPAGVAGWRVSAYQPGSAVASVNLEVVDPPFERTLQLEFVPSETVELRIVHRDNQPVAGARVRPLGFYEKVPQGLVSVPEEMAERLAVTTDGQGVARLIGLRDSGRVIVEITAAGFGEQTLEASPKTPGSRDPRVVALGPVGSLKARLVGEEAEALRGVRVQVHTSLDPAGGYRGGSHAVVTTDEEGGFEISEIAAGSLSLRVLPAEGSPRYRTVGLRYFIEPGKVNDWVIPFTRIHELREIKGRVVDRQGKGVSGALVFNNGDTRMRRETESGGDGGFSLSKVEGERTFLFARKEGFRFGWLEIRPNVDEVELRLTRREEEPERVLRTLAPPLACDEELALVREVFLPFVDWLVETAKQDYLKQELLEVLVRIEPERAVEWLPDLMIRHSRSKANVQMCVAVALSRQDLEEAIGLIEAIDEPLERGLGLVRVADTLPAESRDKKLDLLERAFLHSKGLRDDIGARLFLQEMVAERWFDLGFEQRAKTLLGEVEREIKAIPLDMQRVHMLAELSGPIARVDLDKAVSFLQGEIFEASRVEGVAAVARKLAVSDPAGAERVLEILEDKTERDRLAVMVAYLMAGTDTERALGIARGLSEPELKGLAVGLIAERLVSSNREQAQALLFEAFDFFDAFDAGVARAGEIPKSLVWIATLGALLIPTAEKIDPRLVDELIGRSLSLRANSYGDFELALLVARYDRELALSLLGSLQRQGSDWRKETAIGLSVIEPRGIPGLLKGMRDNQPEGLQDRDRARIEIAEILTRSGEQRWDYLRGLTLRGSILRLHSLASELSNSVEEDE